MSSTKNPGGQRAVTKAEYAALTPRQQGYVSYMQGAWNPEVPDNCPYHEWSAEKSQWDDGQFQGVLAVQDSEE